MIVDLQLNPAVEPWPRLLEGALAAEGAGFGAVWVYDHLSGRVLGGDTMLECFTLLGALATATERIDLGTLVVNVVNRRAGVLAVAAATVQALSAGRLWLGLGAGAAPAGRWAVEHEALGIPLRPTLAGRHARVVEVLAELDRLWADDRPEELAGFPRPAPRPPVLIGVNSRALAAVAGARADGINLRGDHPDAPGILDAAAQARRSHGDPGRPWTTTAWLPWREALLDPAHPDHRALAGRGIDRLVLVWRTPHDPAAVTGAARWLA